MTGDRQSAETALSAAFDDIMRRMSSDNPRSRQHDERTTDRRQVWRCIPIADAVVAREALLAALPASTESTGAEDEQESAILAVMQERDAAIEWADRLAYALGGPGIGEHSNLNDPWQNALDEPRAASGGVSAALDVERLADAMNWWDRDGWREHTDDELWPSHGRNSWLDTENANRIAAAAIVRRLARSASEPAGSAPGCLHHDLAGNPAHVPGCPLASSSSEPEAPGLAEALTKLPPGPYRVDGPHEQGGTVRVFGRQGTPPDFADGWAIPLVAAGVHGPTEALADILNELWRSSGPQAPGAAGQPAGTTNP